MKKTKETRNYRAIKTLTFAQSACFSYHSSPSSPPKFFEVLYWGNPFYYPKGKSKHVRFDGGVYFLQSINRNNLDIYSIIDNVYFKIPLSKLTYLGKSTYVPQP